MGNDWWVWLRQEHLIANEVAILRRVRHPSIIMLIEEVDTTSHLYLVMELVKVSAALRLLPVASYTEPPQLTAEDSVTDHPYSLASNMTNADLVWHRRVSLLWCTHPFTFSVSFSDEYCVSGGAAQPAQLV